MLPAAAAATRANVSKQVFNYWRRTNKLKPADFDENGRALYRTRDVLAVESKTRRSPYSHRSAA